MRQSLGEREDSTLQHFEKSLHQGYSYPFICPYVATMLKGTPCEGVTRAMVL